MRCGWGDNIKRGHDWAVSTEFMCPGGAHWWVLWGTAFSTFRFLRSAVPTSELMQIRVFWDVKPCRLVGSYRSCRGLWCHRRSKQYRKRPQFL